MLRIFVGAVFALSISGCSSMQFFETLGVLSDAYAIKQCREAVDAEENPYAYADCESDYW